MNPKAASQTIQNEIELVRQLAGLDDAVAIAFNDVGWTSRVYLVNSGEIVFKFPRREEVKEDYAREVQTHGLLSTINAPVSFPELCWYDDNLEYLGYRGVRGSDLDEIIMDLTTPQKEVIGRSLGDFLRNFHQIYSETENVILPEREVTETQENFLIRAGEITQMFSTAEYEIIELFICEKYPNQMLGFSFDKVLCHGDLGFWNIIYRGKGKVGVIDFGDTGYYDRSIDFAGMCDEIILESALKAYGVADEELRKKVALRMLLMPIVDLPFYLNRGDQLQIEETIDRIRANLERYRYYP